MRLIERLSKLACLPVNESEPHWKEISFERDFLGGVLNSSYVNSQIQAKRRLEWHLQSRRGKRRTSAKK